MKTFVKWLSGIVLVLLIGYLIGPKPSKPEFVTPEINVPSSPADLENQIAESEKGVKGIKPGNEARIIWADTAQKEKTKVAILYLHGFSGSQAEGDPVHITLAKKYNANLYLARLEDHGTDMGDSTMINLTADKLYASAEKAFMITEKLGEEVIIMGTSGGGALGLFLTSRHPEIKALILYSPCIRLYDKASVILDKHWGLQLARKVQKGPLMKFDAESEAHAANWTLNYRIEGLIEFQNFLSHAMKPEVFEKVRCPVFLAYYYKNEEEQDQTVSVPAMLEMFNELGTPAALRQKVAFPEAGAHVIASYIRSKDWQGVQRETDRFLSEIVKL